MNCYIMFWHQIQTENMSDYQRAIILIIMFLQLTILTVDYFVNYCCGYLVSTISMLSSY